MNHRGHLMADDLIEVVPRAVWGIPISFVNGTVVVYLVRGRRTALIDTAVAGLAAPTITNALSSLEMGIDEIDLVVNTHGHPDHAGGNRDVRAAAQPRTILAHPADAWLMRGPGAHLRHDCDPATALAEFGHETALADRRRFLEAAVGVDAGPDADLVDGDTVDLGGLQLRVLHTPGHTAGSICVFIPELHALFTGDAVQRHGGGAAIPPLYSDATAYRQSLARIADLGPVTGCLSHAYIGPDGSGQPVLSEVGMRRGVQESISAADRLRDATTTALRAGADERGEPRLQSLTARICTDLDIAPNGDEGFARVATTIRAELASSSL